MSLRWQAASAQHAVGLAFAREGLAQPVEDLGRREVETTPVGALLLGEGDQRMARSLGLAQARIVEALAQAEGGEHDGPGLERRQQPVERQAGERQGVDAAARDARHLLQRLGALHRDQPRHGARLFGCDLVLVDDVQRVARLLHVQARERAPGAAHGIEGLAGLLAQPAHALDGLEHRPLGIALAATTSGAAGRPAGCSRRRAGPAPAPPARGCRRPDRPSRPRRRACRRSRRSPRSAPRPGRSRYGP